MKTALSLCALSVLCASLTLAGGDVTFANGRYQLVSAEIPVSLETGRAPLLRRLFKLDTATGQTWVYFEGSLNGTDTSFWRPIPDAKPVKTETQKENP